MPELPEVETIARTLREGGQERAPVVGRVILGASLLWARTLAVPSPEIFAGRLPGQRIEAVGRRGKFLIFQLSLDALLIHLRMSGDIRTEPLVDESGVPLPLRPHDRLALDLSGDAPGAPGLRMAFNDTRKFGRAWLVPDPELVTGGLGPEPLQPHFSAEDLYRRLQAHHRQVKPLLLDQSFLAGLGNIYTDEALHLARIHPLRLSDSLSPDEAARLWVAIRAVLAEGIRRNGASIDWAYRGGDFQNAFNVYQRAGEPCANCGAPVVRILVGQRGTHFCPICQPEPGR
jgi:formamidopyrimidine-DNA glycosylase